MPVYSYNLVSDFSSLSDQIVDKHTLVYASVLFAISEQV